MSGISRWTSSLLVYTLSASWLWLLSLCPPLPNPYLQPRSLAWASNCLFGISVWMFIKQFKFNMFKIQLLIFLPNQLLSVFLKSANGHSILPDAPTNRSYSYHHSFSYMPHSIYQFCCSILKICRESDHFSTPQYHQTGSGHYYHLPGLLQYPTVSLLPPLLPVLQSILNTAATVILLKCTSHHITLLLNR